MRSLGLTAALGILLTSSTFAAKPVLRVNGLEVTDNELAVTEKAVAAQMQQQGLKPTDDMVRRNSVDQLIGKLLLLEAARKANVTADPAAVAAGMDQQRRQMGGEENLSKALAQAGLTEADLKQMLTDQLTIQSFIEKVLGGRATATEQEVKTYYDQHPTEFQHPDQVKLRMFVVLVKAGSDKAAQDAAKAKAEAARERVLKGEDFAKVASEVSDDASKARGGDVGWARKGQLLTELETPVWALKDGEVSPVIATNLGYFVFRVEARRAAGISPFDDVKNGLLVALKNQKLAESVRSLVKDERAKAKIEALDAGVKAALEPPQPPAPQGAPAGAAAPAHPVPAATPKPDAPKKP